jgi:hypothetical protein
MVRTIPKAALALALALPACGNSPGASGPDAVAAEIASLDQRLQGSWRIASYRPDVTLEPNLAALLQLQIQSMTVRFDRGLYFADSPTIHAGGRYLVREAAGPFFRIALEHQGVWYISHGQFSADGQSIPFAGETEPWTGNGELHR